MSMSKAKERKKFDIGTLDLGEIFSDVTDFDLPQFFENVVLEEELEDLGKWDYISQGAIRIGRRQGFLAAWKYIIDQDGVNHVLITGRPLMGKTSGGLSLALFLSEEFNQIFDERNCLGGKVVILSSHLIDVQFPHVKDFKNFIVFIDEIQEAFHRMKALAEGNVLANKFYDSIRKKGVHTIATSPSINSVDKNITEDKLHWWIHIFYKSKRKKIMKAVVYFNACARSGKEWDWIHVREIVLTWVNSKLYFAVTKKISEDKIYDATSGLESFAKEKKRLEEQGLEEKQDELIELIMKQPISVERKAYKLLKTKQFSLSDVESIVGLHHTKIKRIFWQLRRGVKEKEVKLEKKRGRATD